MLTMQPTVLIGPADWHPDRMPKEVFLDRIAALRPDEPHGQEDEIALQLELRPRYLLEDRPPVLGYHHGAVGALGEEAECLAGRVRSRAGQA